MKVGKDNTVSPRKLSAGRELKLIHIDEHGIEREHGTKSDGRIVIWNGTTDTDRWPIRTNAGIFSGGEKVPGTLERNQVFLQQF
jgi:hypothetical protein